jgi:hypothetical protein
MKSPYLGVTWKVGMKVVRIYYGILDYREASIGTITKIENKTKTIYVDDCSGITFDENGLERENFISGVHQEITPIYLEEK